MSDALNFVLLDDVASHNRIMEQMLMCICEEEGIPANTALKASNFEDVLAYAPPNAQPTVFFLDIRLDQDQSGLDVCRRLSQERLDDYFIFVTAYPNHALDCLKLHAYDLLVKPILREDLRSCMRCLYREILHARCGAMLRIPIGSRTLLVPSEQVYYIGVEGRNITAHTAQGDYTWRSTLSELEKALSGQRYVRIHRRYLVNRAYIQEWNDAEDTVLVHGTTLHFSRRMRRNML